MSRINHNNAKHCRGATLIELMIGLVISSVLILGMLTVFTYSNRLAQEQGAMAVMNDSGRFVLDAVAREVRMTGFRATPWLTVPLSNSMTATDADPDTLAVSYVAARDCNRVAPGNPDSIVTNTFDVVANQFRCNGQVLVNGVEDFQIAFGEDTSGDGVANRVVAPGTAGLLMSRVVFIQVSLLLRTENPRILPIAQQVNFSGGADGAGAVLNFNDGFVRREFSMIISLRNPINS